MIRSMRMDEIGSRAGDAGPTLIVVDENGSLFDRLNALELGVAVWRTSRDPADIDLGNAAVVVVEATLAPDWELIRRCSARWTTIVATTHAAPSDGVEAIHAGAQGYVDLSLPDDSLRRTILAVFRGESAYPRAVFGTWLERQRDLAPTSHIGLLTARQREIVRLIAAGSTDRDIADRLGIRAATAQKHVANVLRRLHVRNRAEAVGTIISALPRLDHRDTRLR